MANVLQPNVGFHPRTVAHAPSPLGFGFGLNTPSSSSMSTASSWGSAQPGHTNPAAFHQFASSIAQSSSKAQKRKLEVDDEVENSRHPGARDHSMDRSPTPERPKRATPKRAKVAIQTSSGSKEDAKKKSTEDDNVDLGVLLASLPPNSLLPILTGILEKHPGLKTQMLSLIPRPSLEDAVEALKQASKKLQEAVPFTNSPSLQHSFATSPAPLMRNEYVLGRLRPHVKDFVSTCLSYFPYFSYRYPPSNAQSKASSPSQSTANQSNSLQRDKFHPAETFAFLCNVTSLMKDQPSLISSELESLVMPRLTEEWTLWLDNLNRHVNREGNMVGLSLTQAWLNDLERLGDGKAGAITQLMRGAHQRFPLKQDWVFSQRTSPMMVMT